MRLFRPGLIPRILYPDALFRVKTNGKILFLTFDDGPDPESTVLIISILEKYKIKALFFCCGEAAEKYPRLIELLISEGHMIGNHGYHHLDGWRTSAPEYIADAERAASFTSRLSFRPPFGRLTISQFIRLRRKFKIVFWDLMPYDFDKGFGINKTLRVLERKIRPGAIIVLHDSVGSNAISLLREFIVSAHNMGYRFGNPEMIIS